MTAVDGPELARQHLERAREALRLGDETAAVVWCNLCAETAVKHIAQLQGIDTRDDHFRRTSAARRLFDSEVLSSDLTDLMIRLNNERKHAIYEGERPNLRGRSWEQVLTELEALVKVAQEASPVDQQPEPD